MDGSLHRSQTLSAEPGFGFVSFRPHDGDAEEVIVPLGAVREIRIGAPGPEQALGFEGLSPKGTDPARRYRDGPRPRT